MGEAVFHLRIMDWNVLRVHRVLIDEQFHRT